MQSSRRLHLYDQGYQGKAGDSCNGIPPEKWTKNLEVWNNGFNSDPTKETVQDVVRKCNLINSAYAPYLTMATYGMWKCVNGRMDVPDHMTTPAEWICKSLEVAEMDLRRPHPGKSTKAAWEKFTRSGELPEEWPLQGLARSEAVSFCLEEIATEEAQVLGWSNEKKNMHFKL